MVSRFANSAYLSTEFVEVVFEGWRVIEVEEEEPRLDGAPVNAPKSSAVQEMEHVHNVRTHGPITCTQ